MLYRLLHTNMSDSLAVFSMLAQAFSLHGVKFPSVSGCIHFTRIRQHTPASVHMQVGGFTKIKKEKKRQIYRM